MTTAALSFTPRQRRAFGLLVASEIKIAIRRPVGLLVAVGIPFVLLVIFGSIPATTRPDKALGGISFFNLYVPTLMVFVLIAVGLAGLPQQLATYRQQGVLRRMSTTPVPPSWLLAAQTTVSLILAVIGIGILLGAGAGAFGLALPHDVGGYLVSLVALVLTAVATIGLGLLVASVAKTPQIAQALTLFFSRWRSSPACTYRFRRSTRSWSPTFPRCSRPEPASTRSTPRSPATARASSRLLVLVVWAVGSCVAAVVSSGGSDQMRPGGSYVPDRRADTARGGVRGKREQAQALRPAPSAAGSWPYPNADLANTRVAPGSTITSQNVTRLRQAWTFKLSGSAAKGVGGAGALAMNPIVSGGVVYIQDLDANVYAVALTTGKLEWEHQFNRPVKSGPGPNGVAVAGGVVYGDSAYSVFALNAHTGKTLWVDNRLLSTGQGSFEIQPQVAGGRVYVASASAPRRAAACCSA